MMIRLVSVEVAMDPKTPTVIRHCHMSTASPLMSSIQCSGFRGWKSALALCSSKLQEEGG